MATTNRSVKPGSPASLNETHASTQLLAEILHLIALLQRIQV
jgi:hypothetical protein